MILSTPGAMTLLVTSVPSLIVPVTSAGTARGWITSGSYWISNSYEITPVGNVTGTGGGSADTLIGTVKSKFAEAFIVGATTVTAGCRAGAVGAAKPLGTVVGATQFPDTSPIS